MFGNTKFDYINKRLEWLDREEAKDKAELRLLRSDVRILNDRLHRLLDYLDLEDKWATAQIVAKKVGA